MNAGGEGGTVHVATTGFAATGGYDVIVRPGACAGLAGLVADAVRVHRYALIAPADVAALYGEEIRSRLAKDGIETALLTFPPGETHKTRETWADLTDRLFAAGFGRDSAIIALGGGVAGDLAGFVAATYMRGVPVVQVPTTLLAMIDASVGGKTGVDTAAGKNLVGAFHPPALVVADPLLLRSLPAAELRTGLAEAVKHGAMLDAAYFEWIEANVPALLERAPASIAKLVLRSVELKAAVVAEDPLERGVRSVLNFGHTVGHALERDAGYALAHGSAVAAGMVVESRIGEALGVTEAGTCARIASLLRACGLPVHVTSDRPQDLLPAMRLDKKSRRGEVRCAVPRRIGEPAREEGGGWTLAVPETALISALEAGVGRPRSV